MAAPPVPTAKQRMQRPVGGYDMMPFYKVLVSQKSVTLPPASNTMSAAAEKSHFTDKSFQPSVKTSGSHIAEGKRRRTIHANACNLTVKFVYQMFARTGILLEIVG